MPSDIGTQKYCVSQVCTPLHQRNDSPAHVLRRPRLLCVAAAAIFGESPFLCAETLTKSSVTASGSFVPTHRFTNLDLSQNLSASVLADLSIASETRQLPEPGNTDDFRDLSHGSGTIVRQLRAFVNCFRALPGVESVLYRRKRPLKGVEGEKFTSFRHFGERVL